MSELFIEDYLNKIILLEKRIGAKTTYQILEPFYVDTKNIISIQKTATKIAHFIGLNNLTFVVSKSTLRPDIGGQIELDNENLVLIKISDNIVESADAVLATLSHEITHKYMQIHAISCGTGPLSEYENEILTDITTIFLGFGKLLLNGCEVIKKKIKLELYNSVIFEETIKVGYLDRKQIAFVYRLICAMRKISNNDMLSGLSSEALSAISDCYCYELDYFNPEFHNNHFRNELTEPLMNDIKTMQDELNQINRHLEFIRNDYINKTETFLKSKLQNIRTFSNELNSFNQNDTYDPCLIYLNIIKNKRKIEQIKKRLSHEISDTKEIRQKLNLITKLDDKEKPIKSFFKRIFDKVFRG
ncbi:MAG: hypothetical protein PHW38_05335 [Candidatus Cloacimonetes bacterium]|jgi:hypothetical protein